MLIMIHPVSHREKLSSKFVLKRKCDYSKCKVVETLPYMVMFSAYMSLYGKTVSSRST